MIFQNQNFDHSLEQTPEEIQRSRDSVAAKAYDQCQKLSKKVLFISVALLAVSLSFAYSLFALEMRGDVLLNFDVVRNTQESIEEAIQEIQDLKVSIYVDDEKLEELALEDLGFQISKETSMSDFISASFLDKPSRDNYRASLIRNNKQWNSFVSNTGERVSVAPAAPRMKWDGESGWVKDAGSQGVSLDMTALNRALQDFINNFSQYFSGSNVEEPLVLRMKTSIEDYGAVEVKKNEELEKNIEALVGTPIKLMIGEDTVFLDLNSDEDFITLNGSEASVNEAKLMEWLDEIAADYYRATNTIRIIGNTEPDNAGIVNAITEGEYVEGQRVSVKDVKNDILALIAEEDAKRSEEEALAAEEDDEEKVQGPDLQDPEITVEEAPGRIVYVRLYEIPLKVYSELENTEYELLSVGYSEYSKGNAPNRVHNIKHGLGLINGSLVNVGDTISFNKMVGYNWNGFLTGWGIFGTVAKPVLGGGICQVSTTFYRALLNLGIPITMRQNHSWDLSYYQVGGYGIDATVYPAKGLDVKAINDIDTQLFVYAYTRPETEEAFVLFYGKGDGRKVVLEPEEEYIPWKGAKTLRWTQEIIFPDGTVKRNDIVSRYRS